MRHGGPSHFERETKRHTMLSCRLLSGAVVEVDAPIDDEETTVAMLRARVAEIMCRTSEEISLIFRGEVLEDSAIIEETDCEEDVLVLVNHVEISLCEDWNAYLDQWFVQPGHCTAVGLADRNSGVLFASVPENVGLEHLYSDTHEETFLQDDGTLRRVCINEPRALTDAIAGKGLHRGVWLGGKRYRVIRHEKDNGFMVLMAIRRGLGVCVVSCDKYILLGIVENGSLGNCRVALTSLFENYL
eukprot:TRINITY_DN11382_c0_g3_i1.p1 TRINITY_DN11382_c0_g3~~TRINITY_DN11382_c0_g3_i1.p1  ORF type:complete len:244 (-),score=29.01 TRINITY_DN11382_c0_g3_i1:297-1028(-)